MLLRRRAESTRPGDEFGRPVTSCAGQWRETSHHPRTEVVTRQPNPSPAGPAVPGTRCDTTASARWSTHHGDDFGPPVTSCARRW